MGRIEEAVEHARQSIQLAKAVGHRGLTAESTLMLGDILMVVGDMEESERLLQEAVALKQEVETDSSIVYPHLMLAELYVRQHRGREAQQEANQALQDVTLHGKPDDRGWVRALLALVQQGKRAEAAVEVEQARQLLAQATRPRYLGEIAYARTLAWLGSFREARAMLTPIISAATEVHQQALEYEARLVLAELELLAGTPGAQQQLQALAVNARDLGYGYVANQAEQLASGSQQAAAEDR